MYDGIVAALSDWSKDKVVRAIVARRFSEQFRPLWLGKCADEWCREAEECECHATGMLQIVRIICTTLVAQI